MAKKEKVKKEKKDLEVQDTGNRIFESKDAKELQEELKKSKEKNPENKPSKEEIEKAEKEYKKSHDAFQTQTWEISLDDNDDTQNVHNYLTHFIQNRLFWTKNGWMGVIKLTEELKDAKVLADENKAPIKLGYQALEFLYYSLSNPAGIGLEEAKLFEKDYELFTNVFKRIEEQLTDARKTLKDIQFLQEQLAAMYQGFYLEVEPEEEKEKEEKEGQKKEEKGEQKKKSTK